MLSSHTSLLSAVVGERKGPAGKGWVRNGRVYRIATQRSDMSEQSALSLTQSSDFLIGYTHN
jgi:hypothetical protein